MRRRRRPRRRSILAALSSIASLRASRESREEKVESRGEGVSIKGSCCRVSGEFCTSGLLRAIAKLLPGKGLRFDPELGVPKGGAKRSNNARVGTRERRLFP